MAVDLDLLNPPPQNPPPVIPSSVLKAPAPSGSVVPHQSPTGSGGIVVPKQGQVNSVPREIEWIRAHKLERFRLNHHQQQYAYQHYSHQPDVVEHILSEHENLKNLYHQWEQSLKEANERLIRSKHEYEQHVALLEKHRSDALKTLNRIHAKGLHYENENKFIPSYFSHIRNDESGKHSTVLHIKHEESTKPRNEIEKQHGNLGEIEWWHPTNIMNHVSSWLPKHQQANWNGMNARGLYIASH